MTDVRDRVHGHPYEVVIPCMTLEEANEEKADLNVAAEARAFIREATPEAGVILTPEERMGIEWLLLQMTDVQKREAPSTPWRGLRTLAARLEAAQ